MERKCWDCGNIAEHADNVIPYVLCTKCGSQDTRPTRKKVTHSLAAEIAVAIAGVRSDDYRGMLAAIDGQLDRFGISHMQREKHAAGV